MVKKNFRKLINFFNYDIRKYLSLHNYSIHWGGREGDSIAILEYEKA